jgi:hypothetical protein
MQGLRVQIVILRRFILQYVIFIQQTITNFVVFLALEKRSAKLLAGHK